VAQLHAAKPEDVGPMMAQLRQSYATAWPDVHRDLVTVGKLDPLYQTFATMPQTGAGIVDYAAALKAADTKGDKFGATVQKPDKDALESELTKQLSTYRNSFPPGSGNTQVDGALQSARRLAIYRMEQRGTGAPQAAKDAVSDILGAVDVHNFIRAPTQLPDGTPFSAQKVEDAGTGVVARLNDAALMPPTALNPATGKMEPVRGYLTLRQAQQGQWYTNTDGQSVSLVVNRSAAMGGGTQYVRGPDGKPISFDYRAVPSMPAGGVPATGDLDPDVIGRQGSLDIKGNTRLAGDVVPFVNPNRGHLPNAETPDEFEERLRRDPLRGLYRGGRPAPTEEPTVSPEGEG